MNDKAYHNLALIARAKCPPGSRRKRYFREYRAHGIPARFAWVLADTLDPSKIDWTTSPYHTLCNLAYSIKGAFPRNY